MKKYYNSICSIYTFGSIIERGSKIEDLSLLYDNIKCAIWRVSSSYWQTNQAVQTDSNSYIMDLDAIYNQVKIWDVVKINWTDYKVMNNPLPHERYNGVIDNYEFIINRTTKNVSEV